MRPATRFTNAMSFSPCRPTCSDTIWNEACGSSSTRFKITRSSWPWSSLWQEARIGIGAVAIVLPYSRAITSAIVSLRLNAVASGNAGENHVGTVAEGYLAVFQHEHHRNDCRRLDDMREPRRHRFALVQAAIGNRLAGLDGSEIAMHVSG